MDDVIAKLNPSANQPHRRRDSTDSLNFRDSAFDPMSGHAAPDAPFFGGAGYAVPKGRERGDGLLIQPVAVDPMIELGKGLG